MIPSLDAHRVAGLLADPERLAVLSAVALGARTPDDVAARTALPERTVAAALRRLVDAGLLTADLEVAYEALRQSARREAPPTSPLAPFVQQGRLVSLPAAPARRRLVLEHVAQACFPTGEQLDEPTVNERLRAWCDGGEVDHVALRRYLVEGRLLARRDGTYWRPREGEAEDLGAGPAYVRAMGLT